MLSLVANMMEISYDESILEKDTIVRFHVGNISNISFEAVANINYRQNVDPGL